MSAGESDTANPSGSAQQFPVVQWGYDPHVVDFRMAELVQQIVEERRRGDQAEKAVSQLQLGNLAGPAQGPDGGVGLEADVTEVFQQAGMVAARVLTEAGRRIEATITTAGDKAADRLKAAAQQAGALEQQARQTLAEGEMERTRIEAAACSAAEQVRARADREARAVVARAQEDAELSWQNAAHQRQLLEAEAEALATLRQRMVEQLGRLYDPLGLIVVDSAGAQDSGERSGS